MKTHYFWDPFEDNVIEEFDDDGNTLVEYTTEPELYGNLISQERNGLTHYYHFDGLGSTLALTNDSGDVTDTRGYNAFGETTASTGSTAFPFQFVGKKGYGRESDGDYYVRRRPYRPSIGRWMSVDPLSLDGDMRAYCYVTNRSTLFVDATGLVLNLPIPMPLGPGDQAGMPPIPRDRRWVQSTSGKQTLPCPDGGQCEFEIKFNASIDPNGCGVGKSGIKGARLRFYYSATKETCGADIDRPTEYSGGPLGHITFTLCDGTICHIEEHNFPQGGFFPPYTEGAVDIDGKPRVPPPGRVPIPEKCVLAFGGGRFIPPPQYFWRNGTIKSLEFDFTLVTVCGCKTKEPGILVPNNQDTIAFGDRL